MRLLRGLRLNIENPIAILYAIHHSLLWYNALANLPTNQTSASVASFHRSPDSSAYVMLHGRVGGLRKPRGNQQIVARHYRYAHRPEQ